MESRNGGLHDAASEVVEAIQAAQAISADEIALYDRQIRLWGVQAQENIRSAKILLIRIKAVANEIAKNLVLAGIGSLTVLDDEEVTPDDLGAQFFISESAIGRNRAEAALPQIQRLNPRVQLSVSTTPLSQISDLPSYLSKFSIVIATQLPYPENVTINAACRAANVPFYATSSHGMYGYIFADLIEHEFSVERKKSNMPTKIGKETSTRSIISATTKRENSEVREIVTKREVYSPLAVAVTAPLEKSITSSRRRIGQVTPLLPCFRGLFNYQFQAEQFQTAFTPMPATPVLGALKQVAALATSNFQLADGLISPDFLFSFHANLDAEIAPVTAFLGGHVAQDVINVLGKREQPIQNFVLFDGQTYAAPIYSLHPAADGDGVNGAANGE